MSDIDEQREEGTKRRMNKEKNEQREEWIIIDRMKFFFDTKKNHNIQWVFYCSLE